MSAIGTGSPPNKVVAHWARKLQEAKAVRFPRLRSNLRSSPSRGRTGPSRHRTTIQKNIYVSGWTHWARKSDKENATEAQSTTVCPRNEHSSGTTLGASQYTRRMQDTPHSTKMVRLFTMMRLQKSPPQAPPSWNPNAASTLEYGGSTSTQQHRHLPQKPKQIHSKQSTSFSSSPAPAKHSSGTMHPRDSQLKRPSLTPYVTETTQHGQN